MNYLVRILSMILLITVAAACGDSTSADEPPEIRYGVDVCSRCGMIISEEPYAGGLVSPDGEAEIFDDIGEMIDVVQEEGVDDRRVWVKDFGNLEWLDGTEANFVVSSSIVTPMGSGVIAFGDRADAEASAAENNAEVMSWDEILAGWTYQPRGH